MAEEVVDCDGLKTDEFNNLIPEINKIIDSDNSALHNSSNESYTTCNESESIPPLAPELQQPKLLSVSVSSPGCSADHENASYYSCIDDISDARENSTLHISASTPIKSPISQNRTITSSEGSITLSEVSILTDVTEQSEEVKQNTVSTALLASSK